MKLQSSKVKRIMGILYQYLARVSSPLLSLCTVCRVKLFNLTHAETNAIQIRSKRVLVKSANTTKVSCR